MSLAATWSDESETEESANLVTALTGRWGSDEDSSDDEVTFEELASTYRKLCHKSVELCKQVSQKKEMHIWISTVGLPLTAVVTEIQKSLQQSRIS